MSITKKKILLIDDDKFMHRIVLSTLSDQYDIAEAFNGDEGIALAKQESPVAILLDVEMPGKTGYETCELLKSSPECNKIPIIFISSRDTLREKMLGFEVGAEDYLIKPFEKDILKAKLSLVVNNFLAHQELGKKAIEAQSVAFEALTNSAELGRALRFVEHTYSLHSFDDLAKGFFKAMDDFKLKTSLCFFPITDGWDHFFYSHNTEVISPLEKDLLMRMRDQGRITDFGCRTFFNFRNVCLLIKNMPLEDAERYGRIKDAIPFILGAVDGKIRSLYIHQMLVKQADGLSKSVDTISATLSSVTGEFTQSQDAVREILANILLSLDGHLAKLGLETDQEKYIVNLVEAAFSQTLSHIEKSVAVGSSLTTIVRLLAHLANQQRAMVEKSFEDTAEQVSNHPNDGETYSCDVELF